MLAYPSPRTAIILIGLVCLAACGYFWPAAGSLAVLLALAFALVLAADLILTSRGLRRKLALTREFPAIVTVAQSRQGAHLIANSSRRPLRAIAYEDSFPYIDKRVSARWLSVPPRGAARSEFSFVFQRRGEQALGGMGLRVLAGLGLWVLQYRFESGDKVRVYPQIEELTKGDLFAHRRKLYGIGQHQSRKFGRGTEFDRLREYTPDDEFRQINWKATARQGEPVVNQFQVEQSRDLLLLLDCGRLMHTEIAGRPRLDRYLDAAAHLAYLALSQKDRVGLLAFDNEVRKYIAPARKPRQMDELIDAVFDLEPKFAESDYAGAISAVKARSPKRGLVVLFTDLVDSISSRDAVANLSRLARTHLPVVVILDDPQIVHLAEAPATESIDAFIKASAEQFISEKRRTLTMLRTRGCLIVNVTADKLNASVVNQYLAVKARNLL